MITLHIGNEEKETQGGKLTGQQPHDQQSCINSFLFS